MDVMKSKKKVLTTKNMVRISVLAVISMVLMLVQFAVGFAPPFMKLDVSDLPSLIGGFAMGPAAGVLVQLVKNMLHLIVPGTSTGGIGEISNFVVGSILVYISASIYHRNKTFKNAIIGLVVGVIAMSLAACISNYYVMFPLFSKFMPIEEIVAGLGKINRLVVDEKTLIMFAVFPFNILKGTVTSILALLTYKRVAPALRD